MMLDRITKVGMFKQICKKLCLFTWVFYGNRFSVGSETPPSPYRGIVTETHRS